jgi:hypothetical protein
VNVGRGFLGVLERLALPDDGSGVRRYDFDAELRQAGKTGHLVRMFMPAKLGEPDKCNEFSAGQHRLLQAVVRELTRPARRKGRRRGKSTAGPDLVEQAMVPAVGGKRMLACPLLDAAIRYAAFNGNGVRRGEGYRLADGGWAARAGYEPTDLRRLVGDLAALSGRLGLVVAGLDPLNGNWYSIGDLEGLCRVHSGSQVLRRMHVRTYVAEGWEERWEAAFAGTAVPDAKPVVGLAEQLARLDLPRRQVAADLGIDPSFFTKFLKGDKPLPPGKADAVRAYLAGRRGPPAPPAPDSAADPLAHLWAGGGVADPKPVPMIDVADACLLRGWSFVPMMAGEKKPLVRWKPYQTRRPTTGELDEWFRRWPEAGLALVLGQHSGIFVIDVDGPEAHRALLDKLGRVPDAPLALSGSRSPHRYHLYFRHPAAATKAKATPWHPKLEFRGEGGLIVVPPSPHKSGRRYAWAPGRSIDEVGLPEVPAAVLEALGTMGCPAVRTGVPEVRPVGGGLGVDVAQTTMDFLGGNHADGSGWNGRLYKAACDLHARGVHQDQAEPQLLAGARPWDDAEAEKASQTIASAYSQLRVPSQK